MRINKFNAETNEQYEVEYCDNCERKLDPWEHLEKMMMTDESEIEVCPECFDKLDTLAQAEIDRQEEE